jgi:hypothetical protein
MTSTSETGARFGSEPTICIPPIIEKTGAGSLAAITPLDLFRSTVGKYGNSPAMAVQRPSTQVRSSETITFIFPYFY